MWFYLFGKNERYPDPASEIEALAKVDGSGKAAFLKLSPSDGARLKNAEEGESVYLCTRERGRWLVRADAVVIDAPRRGRTPESMASIYGTTGERHWWRRLTQIGLYSQPKAETDLGLAEGTLPVAGRAHVIHLPAQSNGAEPGPENQPITNPLDQLAEMMDAAWDEGRLTPEAVAEAIHDFRKAHPYGH